MEDWKIEEIADLIQEMRQVAEQLQKQGEGIQAVERNVARILASIKMLELNVSDVEELL